MLGMLPVVVSMVLANMTPSESPAKADRDGIRTHEIRSEFQAGTTTIRVLLPKTIAPRHRYRVVYVLPVEGGNGSRYGDGLAEVHKLDLADKYGVIFVAPSFHHLPWYADHPTQKDLRQESYFLQDVLPFIEKNYPAAAKPEARLLLGFSKSGWGAFTLLLRHPDLFDRAAAWDAPMMMDWPSKYGSQPIFETAENFANYRVAKLLESADGKLGSKPRLALHGYGSFRGEHEKVHALMDRLKIPHEYRDGPDRKHDWHSGWVADAVEFLVRERP